jgi:hypothetical protein
MEGQRLDNFINYNLSCIENESYESIIKSGHFPAACCEKQSKIDK